jgi:hypothetical protein
VIAPQADSGPVSVEPVPAAADSQGATDVVLTSGQHSPFGSLGAPVLLLLAFIAGLGGSALRWPQQLRALALRTRTSIRGRHRTP